MSDRAGHGIDTGPETMNEIVGNVVRDIGDLVRSEIRLAKTEIAGHADKAKNAGGLFGAAAVMGLLAGMCLVTTCIAALSLVLPVWLSALIMMGLAGIIAFSMYSEAKARLQGVHATPKQTMQTLRDDIQWLKQRTR